MSLMADDPTKGHTVTALEMDAEFLVLDQLDLLAQVEAQLRAVHHTMRRMRNCAGPTIASDPNSRTDCGKTRCTG